MSSDPVLGQVTSMKRRGHNLVGKDSDRSIGGFRRHDLESFQSSSYWTSPRKRRKLDPDPQPPPTIEVVHPPNLSTGQESPDPVLIPTSELLQIQEENSRLLNELQELKQKFDSVQRKLSLRSPVTHSSQPPTKIRPPGSSKRGKGLDQSHLGDTAAVYAAGLQYEKYEEIMLLLQRKPVPRTTFFSYTEVIENSVHMLLMDSFDKIADEMFTQGQAKTLGEIACEIDGGWNKRGFTSRLGAFGVILHSINPTLNKKLLWAGTRNMGQNRLINGKEITIVEGTHDGTSHSMETELFQDFLQWATSKKILKFIHFFVADKDSSLRAVVKANPDCGHIKILGDAGHWKSRIYRTLNTTEYFGANGGRAAHKGLAERIAAWTLRCIMEARSQCAQLPGGGSQSEIHRAFLKKFAFTEARWSLSMPGSPRFSCFN